MRFHLGLSFTPKKLLKYALLIAFGLLAFMGVYQHKALAYVVLDNTGTQINITTESNTDYDNPTTNSYTVSKNNYSDIWFWSPSLFTAVGNVNGEYMSVIADYDIGFRGDYNSSLIFYLTSTANTLKATNLRCGVGNAYQSGYDNSIENPTVTDFNVRFKYYVVQGEYIYYTLNVRFNYSQHVANKSINNTNMSCWFERSPSGGLFAQTTDTSFPSIWAYGYQMNSFNFVLSNDVISGQINEVNDKLDELNQNIIEQGEATNEKLDEISDYLTDNTPPSIDNDDISGVNGLLPPGPVDSLLNIPVKFLTKIKNSFNDTCQPYTFNFVFNEPFTLPCFSTFYDDFPASVKIFTELIPSGFILIVYFKHLYKKVDRATSMNTNADDTWGVI